MSLIDFDNNGRLHFERLQAMPRLKREIISYLFDYVARKPHNQWWHYKGEFKYDGNAYNLECDCKTDNYVFSTKNLFIEHKQIEINIEDMVKSGVIN